MGQPRGPPATCRPAPRHRGKYCDDRAGDRVQHRPGPARPTCSQIEGAALSTASAPQSIASRSHCATFRKASQQSAKYCERRPERLAGGPPCARSAVIMAPNTALSTASRVRATERTAPAVPRGEASPKPGAPRRLLSIRGNPSRAKRPRAHCAIGCATPQQSAKYCERREEGFAPGSPAAGQGLAAHLPGTAVSAAMIAQGIAWGTAPGPRGRRAPEWRALR